MGASGSVLEEKEEKNFIPSQSSNSDTVNSSDSKSCPTYQVSLGFWPGRSIELPNKFLVKISYESLDFLNSHDSSPIIQFPYQNIICWGSSAQNFQFKVFDFTKIDGEKKDNGILISLKTTQGRLIEDNIMSTVQKLMVDINQRAISKKEFQALLDNIFEEDGNTLKENWMSVIDQFTSSGRLFLAKQGMELLVKIGNLAPFEKFDLACLLYERIINKNSFQLLVNIFEDEKERENLIHRLKLNKTKKEIVTNCSILPEKS